MIARQSVDPAWWDHEQVNGVGMRQILADRDIGTVFKFLHNRGWSWAAIAQATDIGEQRIREIANGRRRIENYDVYVRIASGLQIPRDYLGVGLRPLTQPASAAFAPAVVPQTQAAEFTASLRGAFGLAEKPGAEDDAQPESELFESQIMQAWLDRRAVGHRGTNLVLVAGFAGSGKTEFARFLSAITSWALLDKDVLTRPLVESMLTSMGGDPNDRHTELYRTEVRPVEYRCLINATFANIDNGVSTVVTAPFLAEVADIHWLRWLLHRCAESDVHLEVVWVGADTDTMHTYIHRRDAARDSWKLNRWDEYLGSIDLALRPQIPHFYVDNSLNAAVKLADEACAVSERIGR
ncbi:AAA family ATPase [Actinospica sp. MGRD01-02]|uniref:AAA family ATPase n=1 Tax=Actinospica acidithermotolerans TaxID=2828514 RepID=A0A941II04_9ACTN|nr:AAA family ATPase [Actinospica acidithermotolerans]MBR7827804.1 AAA family ATPase [Actinospica acidithermotolerans]